MSKILLSGLSDDLLQMISQYSMEVYFKLRLVSKAVKKVIDEVLPIGQNEDEETIWHESWQVKFLRRAHWCGFKLLDRNRFDDWIKAMRFAVNEKDRGDIVEKFCRDYLPKNGCISVFTLECLCGFNRKDYVRELWEEAKEKFKGISERFSPDCIECISMLKDFEFFKMVYDTYAATPGHIDKYMNTYIDSMYSSYRFRSWENYQYLVENLPTLVDYKEDDPCFKIVKDYWKWLPDIKSLDKDKVMKVIKQNEELLLFVDESFRSDKDIVMTAVKQDGNTIEFADESLRKDKEIVMAAVKKTCVALEFADESLRQDKEIVMAAVAIHSLISALQYADESLRKDKEIVMAAVKNQSGSLEFAHESLRKDKEIVMAAMKSFVLQLGFADQSLRKEKEIVLQAVAKEGSALRFAHESLRKDKDIVLQAVRVRGYALRFADESLQRDRDVVLEAFQKFRSTLKFADISLFQDEEFILQALKLDKRFLKFAHDSVRNDKEIVMRVVKLNRQSLQYADRSLQNDPDLLLLASKQDKPLRKRKKFKTE